jgi:hypothetical protein
MTAVEAVRRAALLLPEPEPDGTGDPAVRWRDDAVAAALAAALATADDALVLALAQAYDGLLALVPKRRGDDLVLVSAGTGERRRRGSFATPPALAAELAKRAIPAPVGTVIDPACGAGALLLAALDRLVALGVEPADAVQRLYGVDADPVAAALCAAALTAHARRLDPRLPAGARARIATGDALLGPSVHPLEPSPGPTDPSYLVWHREFPGVLDVLDAPMEPVTGWRGGFDAVVANPPWERLKVFRREGSSIALGDLRSRRADESRTVRQAGRHPLTGAGEVNAYLPFVETCWRLLAPHGRAGIVVPAGISADRSAAALMRALLEAGALESLHLLSLQRAVFEGVSARVGVAVLALRRGTHGGERGGRPAPAEVAVDVVDPAAVPVGQTWLLDADLPRLVNPNTGTVPLCTSARDARLLAAAHRRWPVLRRRDGAPDGDPWQVRLITPLHMTRDAVHFRDRPGPGLMPLWEAKHAGLLDHRGGARPEHRYWVPAELVAERFAALTGRGWFAGYRNVTTTDSARTLVPCALPVAGVGNSLPLIDAPRLPLLLAALASLPVDYLVRQKHAGANLNFFKLEQAAVPPPELYDAPAPWCPDQSLEHWVLTRFAAAVRWHDELGPLAAELARSGVDRHGPGVLALDRDLALAELDAAHAVLLGLDRDDLAHVLSTFTALRVRDERAHGQFLTGARVLGAYDRLVSGR